VEPHYNLASVYLDQGRLDDAEKEYLKTLTLRPGHLSSRIGLSSVYNQKGLYDQAIASLKLAINLPKSDPNFALARLNLGELYGKTGKIENAIKEWEAALKINPSLLPAHFNLGTAYMMTGKLELAVNAFKHCLRKKKKTKKKSSLMKTVIKNVGTQLNKTSQKIKPSAPKNLVNVEMPSVNYTPKPYTGYSKEKLKSLRDNLINPGIFY
jgi:tetratricopeptide (TPR) repeat protein